MGVLCRAQAPAQNCQKRSGGAPAGGDFLHNEQHTRWNVPRGRNHRTPPTSLPKGPEVATALNFHTDIPRDGVRYELKTHQPANEHPCHPKNIILIDKNCSSKHVSNRLIKDPRKPIDLRRGEATQNTPSRRMPCTSNALRSPTALLIVIVAGHRRCCSFVQLEDAVRARAPITKSARTTQEMMAPL